MSEKSQKRGKIAQKQAKRGDNHKSNPKGSQANRGDTKK